MSGCTRPRQVLSGAGSLPSLGLQWRPSSAPGTPQPRPRLLLPAQQLGPPRPFSPRTPGGWGACACADPSSPPAFPTKALSSRSPVRMRFRGWVGGQGGGGVGVFFPPDAPSPLLLPPQASSLVPRSTAPRTQVSILNPHPSLLHNASSCCPFTQAPPAWSWILYAPFPRHVPFGHVKEVSGSVWNRNKWETLDL